MTPEAQAQRDQTASVVQAQQSATQLMAAMIQPGSGTENFEAGMGDWQNWGNAQVVAGTGVSGSQALQVGAGAAGAALQVPNVVGGTSYRLTAQVRVTDPVQGPTTLGVDFYNASGTRIIGTRAPPNVTSTSFAAFSYDVTAPAGTAYALVWVWKDGSTGYAYVDDVTFGPATAPPPPPPPPPPTEGNLISNGGFEAGMTGWTDWGNTLPVWGVAHSGTWALSVGNPAGGAGYVVNGIVPGTNYRLSVSARLNITSDKVFVGVNFVDADGALVTSTQRSTTSTTYTTLTADSVAPIGAVRAVVYVWKDAGIGFAYVDDFAFGVVSGSTPPQPTGPDLLLNGTFENGLASWVNWGNATTSGQAAAGTSAAQVGMAAGGLGQSVGGIVPGNTYRAAAQVKVSSAAETGYLGLKFLDAAGNALQDAVVPFSSTSYTSAQVELVAPPNATTALVYIWKNAGSGYALVDQVELRGAEPAPPALLQPGPLLAFSPETLFGYPALPLADYRITATARLGGNLPYLGGAIVVWSTGSDVRMQKINANGTLAGQQETAATTILTGDMDANTRRLSVDATTFTGWVVGWITPERHVWIQRYDGSGTPRATFTPNDQPSQSLVESIQVRGLSDGGVVAAWVAQDPGTSERRAFVRRFSASSHAVTDRLPVSSTAGEQRGAQITPLPDGTFLVAWAQQNADGTSSLLVRPLDANLVPTAPEQVVQGAVRTSRPFGASLVSLANGTTLIAWNYNDGGTVNELRWQVLDAFGRSKLPAGSANSTPFLSERLVDSIEVVPSAAGFRIVVETSKSSSDATEAVTTLVNVASNGQSTDRTELGTRTLGGVSPTTGQACPAPARPGVAAAGGEDGRYLLAYAVCTDAFGRGLVEVVAH